MENQSEPKGLTGAGKKYLRQFRRALCLPGSKRRTAIRELKEKLGSQEDYRQLVSALGTPENAALALNRSQEGVVYRKSPGRIPCLILGILGLVGLIWTPLVGWIQGMVLRSSLTLEQASVGIIGGTDGPTAIYVTGMSPSLLQSLPYLFIAVIGFLGWYRLRCWKEKQ